MNKQRTFVDLLRSMIGDYVAVHSDSNDWTSCTVGRITAVDEHFVVLDALNVDGTPFIAVRKLGGIQKIEYGTAFVDEAIRVSREGQQGLDLGVPHAADTPIIGLLLDHSFKSKTPVTIWGSDPNEESVYGEIHGRTEDAVILHRKTDNEGFDGFAVIPLPSITAVDCGEKKSQ